MFYVWMNLNVSLWKGRRVKVSNVYVSGCTRVLSSHLRVCVCTGTRLSMMSLYVYVPLCFVIILFDFLFFYVISVWICKTTIFPSLQCSNHNIHWCGGGWESGVIREYPSDHYFLVLAGGEQEKGKTHLVTLSFRWQRRRSGGPLFEQRKASTSNQHLKSSLCQENAKDQV